jgi:alanine dehydrogenase
VKVGVPTEIKTDEYRVALTPAGVRELVEHGHEVGRRPAPARARRSPTTTTVAGREILPDAEAVFGEAEMIVKVKEPQPARSRCSSRATRCSPTCTWRPTRADRGLVESGATCVAYETVEDAAGGCRCSRR